MLSRLPIRGRIALFGAGVVLLTVVLFGALVDVLFERSLHTQQDTALERRAQQILGPGRAGFRGGGPGRRVDIGRPQVPVDLRANGDSFVEFIEPGGASIFSTGEVDGRAPRIPLSLLADARRRGSAIATVVDAGLPLRVYVGSAPATLRAGTPTLAYVATGQSDAAIVAQVDQLRLFLLLGAILSLVGALGASWIVAGRALRPLDRMTETVEAIGSAQDLKRRLPPAPAADEVGRLTSGFNAMLGRLDDAYQRLEGALDSQRRFVADASHELRTPLTSIRSNLGLLRRREDVAPADRAEALRDMDAEAERMSRLVNDLLTLARAEAGQALEMETVDLARVCDEVCRQAGRTHPGRRIELARKPVPTLRANADSLRQLLWILVDNAVKHTTDGGRVTVALDSLAGSARLTVTDDGTGIAAEERERIFERFHRADPARSAAGAGLGLSIARWIVQQHGGHIEAGDNPTGRGAMFTVELPLPAAGKADEASAVA